MFSQSKISVHLLKSCFLQNNVLSYKRISLLSISGFSRTSYKENTECSKYAVNRSTLTPSSIFCNSFTSKSSLVKVSITQFYPYYEKRLLSTKPQQNQEEDDDLKAILKDKSLGITEKFKIIFRQYGLVMIGVHLATSVVWVAIFYYFVSRGLDVAPFLERLGVFDYLEKWGFSFVDKLKSSGASDYVVTYAVYELAKPVRLIVTLFGTMYSVRYLRRKGFIKRPPKSATVTDLVQTQSKIMRNRFKRTTKKYTDKYKDRFSKVRRRKKSNYLNNNGKNI